MRQHRMSLVGVTGLYHAGDRLITYGFGAIPSQYRVNMAYAALGHVAWPHVFDLTAKFNCRWRRATYAPALAGRITPYHLEIGGPVYSAYTGSTSLYYTSPLPRQRLEGQGVNRCSTSPPDARLWLVVVATPVAPTTCACGPRGGFYVGAKPPGVAGAVNRTASPDAGLVRKSVVARGEPDGTMTVCEAVDGPTRNTHLARLTNYPKRNQKFEPVELLVPRMVEAPPDKEVIRREVTDFEFSPDRRTLAVASFMEFGPQCLDLYDFNGKELKHKIRYSLPARLVSFSPDGLTLAMIGHDEDDDGTAYPDKYLTIIDMET